MPLQATSGAASYDAFGGGVVAEPNYIESVFSTYLYTGNGSTQTITNGIDLSTKGGLVWIKERNNADNHYLQDSTSSFNNTLNSNNTTAAAASYVVSPLSNGYIDQGYWSSAKTLVSWTFRKQPKFFDVVTWTGSNDSGTNIGKGIVPHNLGSAPGCVIVKNATSGSTNWIVYHRSLSGGYRVLLNTTDAQTNTGSVGYFSKYTDGVGWAQTNPDANNIYVGYNYQTNDNGATMVAYLFAHDAGGFGLTGTDNVISCGSFSGSSLVTLGYEPQWVLIRRIDTAADWRIFDTMRGFDVSANGASLEPNTSNAESVGYDIKPSATGFTPTSFPSGTYIYIAIRRGPMKVPTLGTSVFSPVARTGTGSATTISGIGFAPDLLWDGIRNTAGYGNYLVDKLRGGSQRLGGASTAAEATESPAPVTQFGNTSVAISNSGAVNDSGVTYVNWFFQRAPGFFDEVCYTGAGSGTTVAHNLGVAPELIITKKRSSTANWGAYHSFTPTQNGYNYLDLDGAGFNATYGTSSRAFQSQPTSTQFITGGQAQIDTSGSTFVAYLFATCAGVSKVGSYTGNGTTQTIDCGFTSGARFVLIKRTDSTGDWYVWDSARGIVAGNDPYLLLNSTAAEVTNTDYIDTANSGFEISSTAPAAINANGGSFIFLAIA